MVRGRKKAVPTPETEEKVYELCPDCEKAILAAGRIDTIETMFADESTFDGGQAVNFLKEGHQVTRRGSGRVFALLENPFDPNKQKGFATVDDQDQILAFWTLSAEELLAEDWILVKKKENE